MKSRFGGMALPNGVLMRSKNFITTARHVNGGIVLNEKTARKNKILSLISKIPFIRGLFFPIFLILQLLENNFELNGSKKKIFIGLIILFAILYGLIVLTNCLASWLFHPGVMQNLFSLLPLFVFFFLEIVALNKVPEFKELVFYHGAEHKAINAYEKNNNFSINDVKNVSRFHPRCGTSLIANFFSILVLLIIFLPISVDYLILSAMSLSIEISILSNYPILKYLNILGLWTQKYTTKEPTIKHLEASIVALLSLIRLEEEGLKEKRNKVFLDFDEAINELGW